MTEEEFLAEGQPGEHNPYLCVICMENPWGDDGVKNFGNDPKNSWATTPSTADWIEAHANAGYVLQLQTPGGWMKQIKGPTHA